MTTLKQWNPASSQWETIVVGGPGAGVVPGGTTGQVLTKTSGSDYATSWQTPTTGGVSTARTISTTAPLTGGGDRLSADRTLAISDFYSTTSRGAVPNPTATSGRFLKDDGTWSLPPSGVSGAGNIFPFTYNTSVLEAGITGRPAARQQRHVHRLPPSCGSPFHDHRRTRRDRGSGTDQSRIPDLRAGLQLKVPCTLINVTADSIANTGYSEDAVSLNSSAGTIPGGQVALQAISTAQSSTLFSTTTTALVLTPGSGTGSVRRRSCVPTWTWAAPPAGGGGGDMLSTNNLSELTNQATARTNLGVAIGTNVQAFDADLATIAGLTATTNESSCSPKPSAWASVAPATAKVPPWR